MRKHAILSTNTLDILIAILSVRNYNGTLNTCPLSGEFKSFQIGNVPRKKLLRERQIFFYKKYIKVGGANQE